MARILSITTRQLRNLEADGLPRRAVKNLKRYPIAECVQWYLDRRLAELRDSFKASDLDALKARKLTAEAAEAELELAERSGRLVLLEHHEQELGQVLDRLRAAVLAIPTAWPPLLVSLETERDLRTAIEPLVDQLLLDLQGVADDELAIDGEAA